jgi:hypothetical protein
VGIGMSYEASGLPNFFGDLLDKIKLKPEEWFSKPKIKSHLV